MSEYEWFGIKESETLPRDNKNIVALATFSQEGSTVKLGYRTGGKCVQLNEKTIQYLSLALDKSAFLAYQFCDENSKTLPPVIYVEYLGCSDDLDDTKDSLICLGISQGQNVRTYCDPIVGDPNAACGLVYGLYALSQVLNVESNGETIPGKKF